MLFLKGCGYEMSKKKKLSILLLILLLLGLLTAAVLASRLGNLNKKKDDGNTISIGDDSQKVSSDTEDEDAPLEANLMIYKDAKIFCTSYDDGRVTVLSADDDKVIAPGTKRNYKFTLYNSKNASLDYKLYVTATVEGLDNPNLLPVQARLKGPDKWVTGNYGNYIPVFWCSPAMSSTMRLPAWMAQRWSFFAPANVPRRWTALSNVQSVTSGTAARARREFSPIGILN